MGKSTMGMADPELLSSAGASRFTVGRDAEGQWVVRDRMGLVGGLFADRASAVHFAMVESDYLPGAVCCAREDEVICFSVVFESRPAAGGALSLRG